MSKIRQRTKNLLLAGLTGATVTGVLATAVIGYSWYKFQQTKEAEELAAQQARKTVLVVKTDTPAGAPLSPEDLVQKDMPKDVIPVDVIDPKDTIRKYAKIDLHANTVLTTSMLYEEGTTPKDLRNQEFKLIQIPGDAKVGQFVDVRIKFPTGQDYILLAKKKVESLNGGVVVMQLGEKEILSFSSAIVDAYLNNAQIYALTYVEPTLQEPAIPTYPPNANVLDLMQTDPNLVQVATHELERRLRDQLEKDLSQLDPSQKLKVPNNTPATGGTQPSNASSSAPSIAVGGSPTQSTIFKDSSNTVVHP